MASSVKDIHLIGTLSARPAAAALNNGYLYCATDVNGGTLYRSDGAAWVQIASGASISSGTFTSLLRPYLLGGS